MSSGFDQVVTSLEARFDHMSARTVAREAVAASGLGEKKDYTEKEVQLLVDTLASLGDRMEVVWASLGAAPTGQEVPAPAPAPAAEAKDDAKEAKDEAKAAKDDAKAEAKDDAKDAKADAKDAKADAKDAKADAKDAKADDGKKKK
ncbi:MAG: hypothetical protein H6744_04130 [Deltaproteobacteria bacterium]|nr:hypothetical protein [Deltaproteobacteria bacterium]MCB9785866.1 hypothetical protein [Deltaproteobacteria bacterium]